MQFLDKWERKLGWMSFPGLLRYYALFHVMVYLLQYLNPQLGSVLEFDLAKIMDGEIWRLVTFLFSTSGLVGLGGFSIILIYFMVIIAFMASDGLEQAWGTFRTSMFYYAGFACMLLANVVYSLILSSSIPTTGLILYQAAFFAFATLFPRVELLLFFVFPVQVRWFAIASAIGILIQVFAAPILIGFYVIAYANYLLWAGIPALRGQARVAGSAGRKKKFNKAKLGGEAAFHRCKSCGRTEISDPVLEFRMAEDGEEYCGDHLPS
jgi:hypothetical protein